MNTFQLASHEPDKAMLASGRSTWRDSLGIIASVGCAIHCAAMPFVIAYLPALGLSFLADEAFHKWMALICFLIAIVAFIPGIKKHGSWVPVSVAALGLVFITYAAFGLAGECCPSCSSEVDTLVAELSGSVAADSECRCADCEDSHTETLAQGNHSSSNLASSEATEKDMLATLAPWITPFGGLLLVSAHLMNRRYGYTCGCCETDSA